MSTASDRFSKDMADTLQRLNARVQAIEGQTIGGLLAAGLKVQRLSQKRVPVEYGKLRASAYTRKAIGIDAEAGIYNAMAVEVGYSAAYAVFVHENMGMKLSGVKRPSGLGHYWGPSGQPKYLQSAVVELQDDIVKTVAEFARRAKSA